MKTAKHSAAYKFSFADRLSTDVAWRKTLVMVFLLGVIISLVFGHICSHGIVVPRQMLQIFMVIQNVVAKVVKDGNFRRHVFSMSCKMIFGRALSF